MNLQGMRVIDLRTTRPDGAYWNLALREHRREALRLIEKEDPDWIICGPPCTAFSSIHRWLNCPKLAPEDVRRTVQEGFVHLRFACKLYMRQIKQN